MKQKGVRITKAMFFIVFLLLIAVVFIATVINLTYVKSIKDLVRSTTAKSISELTVSKAQFLDERLRSEQIALQSLAGSIGADADIFSGIELAAEYQTLHGASCMWILNTKGKGWRSGSQGSLIPQGQTKELFAPALRGESGVSDPFIGELGKRQVLFYTPIRQEGTVVGGLYESYPAQLLQNTYGGATYNDAGYSYVLGKDGSVVLSSVRFSYLQLYNNFRDVLKDGENAPEDISLFMDGLESGKKGSATFSFEGETQFLSFTPLEEKDGWYFVTIIPLSMVERDGTVIVTLTMRVAVVLIAAVTLILILALLAFCYRNKRRREYEVYIQDTYEAISQNIDTVIFILDQRTGKVEYIFENAQDVLGIPAQSFYKQEYPDAGEFQHAIFELLRTERPKTKAVWERSLYNDTLGRQMWLEVTALPVTLGGAAKYIYSFTDITQDRQIREKLSAAVAAAEQANAAKSHFLSNMSHDIRTPMNAIVGMTKLAEVYLEDKKRVKNCLEKIELSSKHLLGLINDVLDMSKIESGKMTMSAEAFSLSELIEGAAAIAQSQCQAKSQIFTVETKNIRHEYLVGDSLRINQVLLNLTSNAMKFTPERGAITLSIEELAQKHSGYATYRFQVSDTGIGIAPEFLSSAFLPFERETTKTVRRTEGTGLGLAIAKNIVESMGGQISVESTVGSGTTFTIELEIQLQDGAKEELESARVLNGRHVLLAGKAEDANVIKSYLTEFGMTVDTAASIGEAAAAALDKGLYDLMILEQSLPDFRGEEDAKPAWDSEAHTKLVLITDSDPGDDMSEQAFDLILEKPIFKSTLCKKLSMLFSGGTEDDDSTGQKDVLNGRRFLLAEDNELNREIATELFKLSGAEIETAADGQAGVEAFVNKEPGYYDAIFMDIQMPVMDGCEATKQIRASNHPQARDIPIIAMSANVFSEDMRASQTAGMNAHLGKPIMMSEVCRVLREYL